MDPLAPRPPYLMMTRGIPASGKSTWALDAASLAPETVTVSMDELRQMIDRGQHRGHDTEGLIQQIQDEIVIEAIGAGRDVIVHNTHVRAKIPNRLRRLTAGRCTPVIVDFADVSELIARQRDEVREKSVGGDVITKMVKGLKGGKGGFDHWTKITPVEATAMLTQGKPTVTLLPQYEPDLSLPMAAIVDLDGTLADHLGRDPYAAEKCGEDGFNDHVWTAASAFDNVVFLSGRKDTYEPQTREWLIRHRASRSLMPLSPPELHMRAADDERPDSIVKMEIFYNKVAPRYNVQVSFDDRDSVVNMWRAIGLPCFQVAPGRF